MKKIAITVFALTLSMCGFAQKKLVRTAEGYLYEQPINFDKAVQDIETAMKDPSSSNMAYTYDVAGQIYTKLYDTELAKRDAKMQFDQDLMSKNLVKAIDAYLKCAELDQLPDEKGKVKQKYTKNAIKTVTTYATNLVVEGQAEQGNNKIEEAFNLYQKYLSLASNPLLKNEGIEKNDIYNDVKFLVVNLAAGLSEKDASKRTLMINYMEDLKKISYKEETMYEWLVKAYKDDNQTDKMLATINEGMQKYPSNQFLIGNMINYYVDNNKEDEANKYLDEAIAKNPNDVQYYKIKGNMFLRKENYDEAIAILTKAVAVAPNDFDVQYYCGLAYEKKGEKIFDGTKNIKDIKKYNAEKNKAIEEYKKSLPFFEKARTINPDDVMNLKFLKSVYYKLSMNDKYKKIDAEIKSKEGK